MIKTRLSEREKREKRAARNHRAGGREATKISRMLISIKG